MSFLSPFAALFALALPIVVVFYLLKRKRVVKLVGSTLLWQKFLADTQASAPFQKLRHNWLLILQLLLLALVVFALMRPFLTGNARDLWTAGAATVRAELDTLDALIAAGEGTFDFAFIDADKSSYAAYLQRVWALLRTGGVVLIDNVLWSGRVIDPADTTIDTEALRALNAGLREDPRWDRVMLPVGDGLTLLRKR